MLQELEEMSLMFDFLPRAEARRLINEVARILAKALRAQIIDVIWRKEARGGTILEPFAWYVDSQCGRGQPKPYQIPEQISDSQKSGLWTYVYSSGQDVLIEKIIGADLDKPLYNKATKTDIEARFLYIWGETNTFIATPLRFRDVVYGVFCIELPGPHKLTEDVLKLMRRLATPIATIIWKADAYQTNYEQTKTAISHYINSIQDNSLEEFLTQYRSGFIARSFDRQFAEKFSVVEGIIEQLMSAAGVRVQHCKPEVGNVIESMTRQISCAHFGIVDITQNNPNVMMELGMMRTLGKKVLLLRDRDDKTEIPFNIYNDNYYSYEVKGNGDQQIVNIYTAGDSKDTSFKHVIGLFIADLLNDHRFRTAKEWSPEAEK